MESSERNEAVATICKAFYLSAASNGVKIGDAQLERIMCLLSYAKIPDEDIATMREVSRELLEATETTRARSHTLLDMLIGLQGRLIKEGSK